MVNGIKACRGELFEKSFPLHPFQKLSTQKKKKEFLLTTRPKKEKDKIRSHNSSQKNGKVPKNRAIRRFLGIFA
ncbi:MAG: hypothetical protein E7659_02815 [Ruminococcaceae bacterium]|nr:hypothetical protein [Oscillospiraceae bacterium]